MADATLEAPIAMATKPASQPFQQLPLSFLKSGETGRVCKVRGSQEMRHHLENLGFVPGAVINVVSEHGGSLVVEIKGAQVGLDRSASSKVIVASY